MSDETVEIFCGGCGATSPMAAHQVTAALRCKCGSADLGLVGIDDVPQGGLTAQARAKIAFNDTHVENYRRWAEQEGREPEHVKTLKAYEKQPGIGRAHADYLADQLYVGGGESNWRQEGHRDAARHTAAPKGPGTGWTGPDPRRLEGWSEYAGPTPQTYPRSAPVADSTVCPVCHGSKYDLIDKGPCRECGGLGYITHPTNRPATLSNDATTSAQPAGGAGWHGASRQGGLSAEALARVASGGPRRLYAEHPSGYRAEWTGGDRYHVYEGDTPVDSPPLPGYSDAMTSSEAEANRAKFKQQHLTKGLHSWVKNNGAEYMDFNHPTDRPSYGDRHGFTGARVAPGSNEDVLNQTDPSYRHRHQEPPPHEFDPRDSQSFYPKAQSTSPDLKSREQVDYNRFGPVSAPEGVYQMDQASCPNCGHAPTELRKDNREDAWWTCPQCGPLANIDARPEINPYGPPKGFVPDRKMKTGGFIPRKKTGRLMEVLAKVAAHNDGLTASEALDVARNTLRRYPEGR